MKPATSRSSSVAALSTAVLCLLLTFVSSRPPRPRDSSADGSFSATEAIRVLETIYADGVTHPIGSPENRRYKERILEALRQLGYEPTVQRAFVCRASRACGLVENILARLEGTGEGPAVLLADHYDSVGAGPSVSDDGVAVAISLEIARLLKRESPPDNDVIFLIDDGEESGLLGAIAFAEEHAWAEDVGAVVNLEARGTAGRSYMFETGPDNAWLIELMKRYVPHPATSSLFYSVYQQLPNDTDFTIFREHGWNGVNFAFIDRVVHYHTPLDDLLHVTPATVQHQGENALAMVRALANANLDSPPAGTASWFDVWGLGIVSWPETWNLPLSVLALLLALTGLVLRRQRRSLTASRLFHGLAISGLAWLGPAAAAIVATWILAVPGQLPTWPATSFVPRAAFWLLGISGAGLVLGRLGRRAGAAPLWIGLCVWMALLAILAAAVLPGVAYVFLAPALVGALLSLPTAVWRPGWLAPLAYSLTVAAACATQLVLAWDLWEALGTTSLPLSTFFVAGITVLVLAPAADTPETVARRWSMVGLALVPILAIVAILLPAYSEESPRPLNLYFVQDADAGTARLLAADPNRPLADDQIEAVDWNQELERMFPWLEQEASFRAAPEVPIAVTPPSIEILEQKTTADGRQLRLRLRSARRADQLALFIEDSRRVLDLTLEGWELDLQDERLSRLFADDRRLISVATFPEQGLTMDLEITGTETFELTLVDSSYGLPPTAESVRRARPSDAVPIDRGDRTLVHTRVQL